MDKIIIRGGKRLAGTVPVSGAKNAALTLLPCALLTDEPVTLRNLPRLADIDGFQHLLNQFGVSTTIAGNRPEDFGRVMTLAATRLTGTTAPYELVRKMRASILVLGPLLARAGEATVSLPGGCAIGNRPIDLHLKALQALGAEIELAAGYVRAIAPKGGLTGGEISFPTVSVGATENALMAAVLARGTCRLANAAREPEIVDLCNLLVAMGASIAGIGSSNLTIPGAGRRDGGVRIAADGELRPLTLSTAPYPGFATDMQAQMMALLCRAPGASVLTETIFENRYMHVPELNRMGARTCM